MKKFLSFFFLLSLISSGLSAQSDFRPGYMVLMSGDTLRGEIDLQKSKAMSKTCTFRMNKKSEKKTYIPQEIKEYHIEDDRYFISQYLETKGWVFIEYLVEGKLNLLYNYDQDGGHYYVRKEGDTIREIPITSEYVFVDGLEYKNQPIVAKTILSYVTSDVPELNEQIQDITKVNHSMLMSLAIDYHRAVCTTEDCIVYSKNIHRIKGSAQPFIGVTHFSTVDKFVPDFGIFILLCLPVTSEKIYFKTGFIRTDFSDHVGGFFKIPLQVRYQYPGKIFRPELSLGPKVYLYKYKFDTKLFSSKGDMRSSFDITGALNVKFPVKDFYMTFGGSLETTPVSFLFTKKNSEVVSYSFFAGLTYNFRRK